MMTVEQSQSSLGKKNQVTASSRDKKLYKSKYDPTAPLIGSTFAISGTVSTSGKGVNHQKKTCVVPSWFGPQSNTRPDPTNFLKRGTGPISSSTRSLKENLCNIHNEGQEQQTKPKPPVPSRKNRPVMGIHSEKDFITSNAVEVISSHPPPTNTANDDFMESEGYGEVPSYLSKVKQDIANERATIEKYLKKGGDSAQSLQQMDERKRQDLINNLKRKWDEINSQYQKICHRTIFQGRDIRRKEDLERDLDQLEKDIELLSRPGPLYITKS